MIVIGLRNKEHFKQKKVIYNVVRTTQKVKTAAYCGFCHAGSQMVTWKISSDVVPDSAVGTQKKRLIFAFLILQLMFVHQHMRMRACARD